MIAGFKQKIGFWPKELITTWKNNKIWLWFHGVSVGEINAILPLILKIKELKSEYPIMLSTTTKAGYQIAKTLGKEHGFTVFFFPFDIPITIKKLLLNVKIKLLVIAETEIWPNLLQECKKRNIPTVLVNARLSDRSYKNYHLLKSYFNKVVNNFTEIISQSTSDTEKFISLGLDKEKIRTYGNLKFVPSKDFTGKENSNKTGYKKIIFASTHPGEDEIALDVYKNLKSRFLDLQLIIAPRHIDRTNRIKDLVLNKNLIPSLWSEENKITDSNKVLLIDTIGELQGLFKDCYITILCGTFAKIGGHNILEPIRAGSFTIIGPNDFKIKSLSKPFLEKDALFQVQNTNELITEIEKALTDEEYRKKKIENGIRLISENKDVLENTKNRLLSYL